MSNKRLFVLMSVLTLLATTSAKAADFTDMAVLHHHYLLGEWKCKGTITNPHNGEQFDTVGSWEFHKKGDWVTDHFSNYTAEGHHYSAMGWTHYDRVNRRLSRHMINNWGGWGRYVSDGWDKDTMAWQGRYHPLGHHGSDVAQVLTKKDEDSFSYTVRSAHHGDWQDMYTGDCVRRGSEGKSDGGKGTPDQGPDQGGKNPGDAGQGSGGQPDAGQSDEPAPAPGGNK